MSSMRCRRKTSHTRTRESENFKPCPNRVPGLLRLDSTGEVTSAGKVSNCKVSTAENDFLNCRDAGSCKTNNYKNFVDNFNLKMSRSTLINSASACLGSAKSYIESFCPKKTSNSLARSKSESSSFDYLQSMLDMKSQSKFNNTENLAASGQEPEVVCFKCNTNSAETEMSRDQHKPMKWTGNIFGAIQCSLLSNCSTVSDKMKNVEKYVPPQRRCVQSKTNNITAVVDPTLTPYNARLLEKSKRSHTDANVKRDCIDGKYSPDAGSPKVYKRKLEKPKQNPKIDCGEKVDQCHKAEEKPHQIELDYTVPINTSESSGVTADEKTADSGIETDWFEYECDSAKCIPIPVEKIQVATQKHSTNKSTQDSDSKTQQLHSWFSVENDSDAASYIACSAAKDDSSLIKNDTELCAEASNCIPQGKLNSVHEKGDKVKTNSHSETENQQDNKKQNSLPDYESKDHGRTENVNSICDNNPISVLYVRSFGKKGRPSAKKRRRQKAQQNENNEQSNTSCDKSSSDLAFILGYDNNSAGNVLPSFHVSCDIDCDSDWTDSDCESDENFSSLEDENLLGDLGFQCNDLRNMHFTLTCSVQPTDQSPQSSNSSAIDDINMSWRVQVSVEPESRKNESSKKVHFPDDNDLATVHPIIAWSYAYQAARKGPWEQYARDRGRFLRRITDVGNVLKPVLNQKHRDKIIGERFCVN